MTPDVSGGNEKKVNWCFRPVTIVIAILAIGPFALPLVWLSPAVKKRHKIVITILLVLATIWMVQASVKIYQSLLKEMRLLQGALQ